MARSPKAKVTASSCLLGGAAHKERIVVNSPYVHEKTKLLGTTSPRRGFRALFLGCCTVMHGARYKTRKVRPATDELRRAASTTYRSKPVLMRDAYYRVLGALAPWEVDALGTRPLEVQLRHSSCFESCKTRAKKSERHPPYSALALWVGPGGAGAPGRASSLPNPRSKPEPEVH